MDLKIPKSFIPLLRTDHAGETGAVFIYKGILLVSKDKEVLDFSSKHLITETEHLKLIEEILDRKDRSKLIFFWKIAGFLTGFIPALLSKKFVFATIFYVESFVEEHYQDQIDKLKSSKEFNQLKNFLKKLQDDEISHKDEAFFNAKNFNKAHKLWGKIIENGSSLAVSLSKKI